MTTPAIVVPVEGKWIDQAIEYFREKDILYFLTNSKALAQTFNLRIQKVYFKLKGESAISYEADFLGVLTQNPSHYRLPGCEDEAGLYYYGFRNLRQMDAEIELPDLCYFTTGNNLLTSLPGVSIIADPLLP